MKIRIIEAHCQGKFSDARNEDRIFSGIHHVAVVDGSSAAEPVGGRAGGIVAAETVVDILSSLEPDATIETFETAACQALEDLSRAHGVASPYAAVVVLSLERQEIWRIGDCPFALDGVWNIPEPNPHERAFFFFRQMMASGYAHRSDQKYSSAIAEVTRDWLAMTKHWVNADGDPFAFAALDQRPAPARFLEVFPVPTEARTIALASDGAVVSPMGQRGPRNTVDMLNSIAALKSQDPMCITDFPYWRGFLDGATLLDDATFLAVAIE